MDLKKLGEDKVVICPKCGNRMKLRGTERHTYRNGRPHLFWSCLLWPICETTIGSDPRGNAQGTPADVETKQLRIRCHEVFDAWWNLGQLSRKEAYRLLQNMMNMTSDQAHFANFNKEQCLEFLRIANEQCDSEGYLRAD